LIERPAGELRRRVNAPGRIGKVAGSAEDLAAWPPNCSSPGIPDQSSPPALSGGSLGTGDPADGRDHSRTATAASIYGDMMIGNSTAHATRWDRGGSRG
jgi:hypothetical protein